MSEPEPPGSDFDRGELLSETADLIESSYLTYLESLEELEVRFQAFTSQPDQTRLDALRSAWSESLTTWQSVAPFDFGKASDIAIVSFSNTYPADAQKIEENIQGGVYNLESASNIDATGLQAIDFLIHGLEDNDVELIDTYANSGQAADHATYLEAIIEQLKIKATQAAESWNPSAIERIDFINNTGTDQGSSIGLLLNAFNESFEKVTRSNKLGIPAGALTFSMTPNPHTVEAYHENIRSLSYLNASLSAFETIYYGRFEDSVSLDDYLIALDARHGDQSLDAVISEQLQAAKSGLALCADPLSEFVVSDQQTALDAYAELQGLVVLWKVDMMSALGVLITYQDNDGD